MAGSLVSAPGIESKYNPIIATEYAINAHFDLLQSKQDKIVTDKLGKYFYTRLDGENDIFIRFALLHQDSILENLFAREKGLMEPVYTNIDGKYTLDWEETKRRYSVLTKQFGLTLCPLQETRDYHRLITREPEKKKEEEQQREEEIRKTVRNELDFFIYLAKSAKEASSQAISGEDGLYNPQYFDHILSSFHKKATYLVSFGQMEGYFRELRYPSSHSQCSISCYKRKNVFAMNMWEFKINFIPFAFFENLQVGGMSNRALSGCVPSSRSGLIAQSRLNSEMMDIPYYSAIATIIKDNHADQKTLRQMKKSYLQELQKMKDNWPKAEQACRRAFTGIGLSGHIRSEKLR